MKCTAKRRDGQPCQTAAMPNGRCRLHGGKAGRPPTNGLQSRYLRSALSSRADELAADLHPLDLLPELGYQRALLESRLGKLAEGIPIDSKTRAELMEIIEAIGRTVERISRIQNATALTAAEVDVLRAVVASIILDFVPEDRRTDAISRLRQALGVGNVLQPGRANGTAQTVEATATPV